MSTWYFLTHAPKISYFSFYHIMFSRAIFEILSSTEICSELEHFPPRRGNKDEPYSFLFRHAVWRTIG